MRTTKQNSAYWLLIVEPITAFYSENNGKLWRDMYKALGAYLPAEYEAIIEDLSKIVQLQLDKDITHTLLKKLFNNGESTRFIDSPDKKATVKMQDYEHKIRSYYAVYGLQLAEANEVPPIEFIE